MRNKLQEQFNQAVRIYNNILNAVSNRNYGEARFLLKGLELVKNDMKDNLKRKEK